MSKFLKGNYKLEHSADEVPAGAQEKPADVVDRFERRALECLGGSIAFVMKRNTFVWNGDRPEPGEKDRKS